MNWSQLKQAFNNRSKIWEGLKNNVFKQEHIEAIYQDRMELCSTCINLDIVGNSCAIPGTQPCCSACGCSLGIKLRSLSSECPIQKWVAVTTEQEEEMIKEQINSK